jgi:cytoskeletal protein RodZ
VYVKSFLRTYGDFLGVDSRLLVDEYKRRYERPADQDLRPISSLGRERERRRRRPRLGRIGVIVLALGAVAVALYLVGTLGNSSTTTSSTPTGPVAAGSSTSSTSATSHRTGTHKAPAKHHHAAPPPKPTKVTVKLEATSTPVYVCVEDGNGKVLIPGVIYSPGQTIPTQTARKLLMTFGNSAVQMKINGKTVPVGPGAPVGYEATPAKTTVLSAAQRPTCG